jgi:hypothetical protein
MSVTNDEKGAALGWDVERIEDPNEGGSFALLPDGDYPFIIVKFERGRFDGSDKMCACPKAIITCEINSGEFGTTELKHNLYLNRKTEGLLCQFFTSVSLRKHGEPLVLAWNRVVGLTGMCQLGQREYKDKKYNEIRRFLDPPDSGTPQAAPTGEPEIPF